MQMATIKTLPQLATEAIFVQDAVNIVAVSRRFGAVVTELRQNLADANLPCGTDDLCQHPITQLWASKLIEMSCMGMSDMEAYRKAWEACDELAKQNHPINA